MRRRSIRAQQPNFNASQNAGNNPAHIGYANDFLIAKKSLGQNFLKNTHIIEQIVAAGEIKAWDTVIEIGPGAGALTGTILKLIKSHGKGKLIAIEKDSRAIKLLKEKFGEELDQGIFQLIEGDFLEINLAQVTSTKSYTLIGNIPYYITGAIIRHSLEAKHKPSQIVFLVQKEVAERIVCRNTKHSILSQSIAIYGTPELLMTVSRGNFVPIPKVDSAVIRIKNISDNNLTQHHITSKLYFDILHAGFAHKRKKLFSNIFDVLKIKKYTSSEPTTLHENAIKESLFNIFVELNFNEGIRAEELTTQQWILLVSKISSDIL